MEKIRQFFVFLVSFQFVQTQHIHVHSYENFIEENHMHTGTECRTQNSLPMR